MANIAQLVNELIEGGPGRAEPKYLKKDRTQERMIRYKGKGISKLHPSGMFEFYSDAKKRFLKFDDLDAAKAGIDGESSVTEAKKRFVFDPISKKKVPMKSIKAQAGGPVTRNGKPVPDDELKSKDRPKKKEESSNPADIRRLVANLLSEDCGNVCHQCGKDYRTDENGVNTHCGPNGEGDFDADEDHVPYGEVGAVEDTTDPYDEFADYSPVDKPFEGDEEFRNRRGDTGSYFGRH